MKKNKFVKQLNAILRENRIKDEANHGRMVSKTWDKNPTNKKDRAEIKRKLKKVVIDPKMELD